ENGENCAINQLIYHLASRGIEYDVLPAHQEHHMPLMADRALAHRASLRKQLLTAPIIQKIADRRNVTPLHSALAWAIRFNNILAIPKAVQEEHIVENAEAATIELTDAE